MIPDKRREGKKESKDTWEDGWKIDSNSLASSKNGSTPLQSLIEKLITHVHWEEGVRNDHSCVCDSKRMRRGKKGKDPPSRYYCFHSTLIAKCPKQNTGVREGKAERTTKKNRPDIEWLFESLTSHFEDFATHLFIPFSSPLRLSCVTSSNKAKRTMTHTLSLPHPYRTLSPSYSPFLSVGDGIQWTFQASSNVGGTVSRMRSNFRDYITSISRRSFPCFTSPLLFPLFPSSNRWRKSEFSRFLSLQLPFAPSL